MSNKIKNPDKIKAFKYNRNKKNPYRLKNYKTNQNQTKIKKSLKKTIQQ